ncbi:MAG: ACT domain-containing protein [Planctomycetota bacterium]
MRCAHPLFVGRTDTELSIVGPLELESELGPSAEGFRLLTIRAEFGTTETGIFVTLALPLAEAGCWILPLGTHDTDHLLVREDQLERAVRALASAGHTVEG